MGWRAWRVFLSLSAHGIGRPATPRGHALESPVSTGTSHVLRSRARSPARGPRLQGSLLPEGRRRAAERDAVTSWRAASSFTGDIEPRLSRRSTQPCSPCAWPTRTAASRRGQAWLPGTPPRVGRYGPQRSWPAAISSAPARRPSSSGSRTGEPTSATAPMGSGPQRQSCGFLAAAHAWASVKTWRGRASRSS